jgi:undecaprenyl-diphosphatase
MTTVWEAALLGVIQGITEWLPVSSSGHLVIAQQLLSLSDQIGLDIMLHMGSLVVVLIFFNKEIYAMIMALYRASLRAIQTHSFSGFRNEYAMLGLMTALGTVPTAIMGFIFEKYVTAAFDSIVTVGFGLMFTSLLLWLSRTRAGSGEVGWKDALIIGTMQGIATLPGVSRSGSTISTGLIRGLNRDVAARFSFMLFIPAILGALILKLNDVRSFEPLPILVGTLSSMVISYIAIGLLLKIVRRGKFYYFSYYCFAIGLLVIIRFLR